MYSCPVWCFQRPIPPPPSLRRAFPPPSEREMLCCMGSRTGEGQGWGQAVKVVRAKSRS
jgi:hypothetical protein